MGRACVALFQEWMQAKPAIVALEGVVPQLGSFTVIHTSADHDGDGFRPYVFRDAGNCFVRGSLGNDTGRLVDGELNRLVGALTNLGLEENEASAYAEGVRRGGTLVVANAVNDGAAMLITQILSRHLPPDWADDSGTSPNRPL